MSSKQANRRTSRQRPRVDALEARSLLSVVSARADTAEQGPIVTAIFEHELHRDPSASELHRDAQGLASGTKPISEAEALLVSRAYRSAHPSDRAFVDGLYADVLGRAPDASGEQFWVQELQSGQDGRQGVARSFLASSSSYLGAPLAGSITNVSATNGWSSGIQGTTAFVAGVFNNGTPPTTITINVSASGQYVLNQSNSSFIGNNSGRTWRGFTLTILGSSTAGASFSGSSDVSGHFPTAGRSATAINFSGGLVTSGTNVIVNGFQPLSTLTTTRGGTIVIQETPVNA